MPFIDTVLTFGLACVRPGVMLALTPFTAPASAGMHLRVPLTLALGWLSYDAVSYAHNWMPILLKEALLGLVLGFLVNRVFAVVGMAASVIALQASYTAGSMYDPNFEREGTAIEGIFLQLLSLMVFAAGGLGFLVSATLEGLRLWPLADMTPDLEKALAHVVDGYATGVMQQMLALVMPLLVLLVFVEICLGLVGRHAQQLNAFSLAMPVKIALLILAIWMTFPTLVGEMHRLLENTGRLT